jgi:hypothetical protein
VDLEISITDMRDTVSRGEIDCLISAEPQHRVSELSAALLAMRGGGRPAEPPGIWLDGSQLDPAAPLASTGIRAGSRVGFGGQPPVRRAVVRAGGLRPGWGTGPGEVGPPAAELRVISGPDAGLIAPLAPGDNGRPAARHRCQPHALRHRRIPGRRLPSQRPRIHQRHRARRRAGGPAAGAGAPRPADLRRP